MGRLEIPTLYPDANIFSSKFYTGGATIAQIQHVHTEEWWKHESQNFAWFVSEQTLVELENGRFRSQKKAIAGVKRVAFLPLCKPVLDYTEILLQRQVVPAGEYGDALHLAFATIYNIDYFLTWNQRHLASTATREKLARLDKETGRRSPLIVSPLEIPWVSKGGQIRRK